MSAGSSRTHKTFMDQAERTFCAPSLSFQKGMWAVLLIGWGGGRKNRENRFGDSWQSVTHKHTHMHKHTVRFGAWQWTVGCVIVMRLQLGTDWGWGIMWELDWESGSRAGGTARGRRRPACRRDTREDLLQLTLLYSVRLMSAFVSSHTHCSFRLRWKTLTFSLIPTLSLFFHTPGHLTNQKLSSYSDFTISLPSVLFSTNPT